MIVNGWVTSKAELVWELGLYLAKTYTYGATWNTPWICKIFPLAKNPGGEYWVNICTLSPEKNYELKYRNSIIGNLEGKGLKSQDTRLGIYSISDLR